MSTSRKATRKDELVEDHSEEIVAESPSEEIEGIPEHDYEVPDPVPALSIEDETKVMQEQIKYQMAQLMKLASRTGTDLSTLFETPPRGTVVQEGNSYEQPAIASVNRPRPGTVLGDGPNASWVPWRREDLDPEDMIEFVPQPVPSLVFPLLDEDGHQVIKLDLNDLVCWMTVGVPNKINRFFYNGYMDCYNNWKDLENFKRKGPISAPWGDKGPDGRPTWHYEPMALTFGLDPDGRYLSAGRQTFDEFEASIAANEESGAPL